MRGGWWDRQEPVSTIQVCLGATKCPNCMFSKFPIHLSLTKPSLHYPTVFGLKEMAKMCVFKVSYQFLPKKTQLALSNCVLVIRKCPECVLCKFTI